MSLRITPWVLLVGVASLLAGAVTPASRSELQAEQLRTVYISAQDSKGVPVTDLTTSDLSVKEGGKDRAIASLLPATAPMTVSILVDDGGSGAFQAGVYQFLQATLTRGQFAISVLNPQPMKLVDYTNDVEALKGALGQLGQRGRVMVDGEQMLGAVVDSAKALQRSKAERPVIIALSRSGETAQSDHANAAMNALRSSRASLNVLYITGIEIGRVLGDGPKQSGGMLQQAGSGSSIAPALAKIAQHLMSQYVMTYTLPDGVKPNGRLAVSTSRKGVTLIAPSLLPE